MSERRDVPGTKRIGAAERSGPARRARRALHGGNGRGSRIPEELWQEAVKLARGEGVWATARALRFNYERLRERVDSATQAEGKVVGDRNGKPAFVALGMDAMWGGGKAVVELVSRQGARMRIEVTGGSMDVAGLMQAFRSRRP